VKAIFGIVNSKINIGVKYLRIIITVNNKELELHVKPGEFLADTLRANGFLSVKKGCDTGSCGVCTVWVNGEDILSCNYLAVRANGKHITTIEGIEEEAKAFASFLAGEGADQCGYCAPGFMMTVIAMKKQLVSPSEEEVAHYLNGNLCRCTGYKGQMRAIMNYLQDKETLC
jgi:carbon-monoxide dehydrogenase small subunit